MRRRIRFDRLCTWAFVAALLLKAAVPMLASASAALQGRPVAEVCEVYGVDTSHLGHAAMSMAAHGDAHGHGHPHPDDGQGHGTGDHGHHGSEHCALGGLLALGGGAASATPLPAPMGCASAALPPNVPPRLDAAARWAAAMGHAPPPSA